MDPGEKMTGIQKIGGKTGPVCNPISSFVYHRSVIQITPQMELKHQLPGSDNQSYNYYLY